MKPYAAYAIGAALVDTEIQVSDAELEAMNVEKGMMTLVDQDRQADMLAQLSDHLVRAVTAILPEAPEEEARGEEFF